MLMQASVMQSYLVCSSATNAVAGAYCAARWFRVKRRRSEAALFGWFSAAIACWSLLYFTWQLAASPEVALHLCGALLVPAGFIGPVYFHLIRALSGKPVGPRLIALLYGTAGLNAVFAVFGLSVSRVEPLFDLPYWPRAGAAFPLFLFTYSLFALACGLGSFAARSIPGYRGNWLRIHCAVAVAGVAVGFANLPGWYGVGYPPWTNGLVSVYLLGSSYSLRQSLLGYASKPAGYTRRAFLAMILCGVAASLALVSIGLLSIGTGAHPSATTWVLFLFYHIILVAACYFVIPRALEFQATMWRYINPSHSLQSAALARIETLLPAASPQEVGKIIVREVADASGFKSVAIYLVSDDGELRLAGASGSDDPVAPDLIAATSLVAEEILAHGGAVEFGWLDAAASESWVLRWQTAIPVISGERITALLLVHRGGKSPLSATDASYWQAVLFRIEGILQLRRVANQLARQESLVRLGYLASGMAHEVRNPLTSIKTFVDLAHRGQLSGPAEEALYKEVNGGIDRMLGAIEAVLAYADNRPSKKTHVSVAQVVAQTTAIYAAALRRYAIDVLTELPENLTVFGNQRELLQVFANLFSNAIDAIRPTGKGRIIVVGERLASSGTVRIKVSDSGPGLPQAVVERLGQPFVTTKTLSQESGRKSGYGLGLSIVHDRIVANGGTFGYQAPSFVFTLPAHENGAVPSDDAGAVRAH